MHKKEITRRDALDFRHSEKLSAEFKKPYLLLTKSHVSAKDVRDNIR
jgi:hypothetical protein